MKAFEQEKMYKTYFWYDGLQVWIEKVFGTLEEAKTYIKTMKTIFKLDMEFGVITLYPQKPQMQEPEQR